MDIIRKTNIAEENKKNKQTTKPVKRKQANKQTDKKRAENRLFTSY